MTKLKKEIEQAPIVNINDFNFKVYSFGERGQKISHQLLKEITQQLAKSIKNNFNNFDYIISPEPGGHVWGSLVSLTIKKDLNILRLNPSKQNGEIKIFRKTTYNSNVLFLNKFKPGDKVIIVDDIVCSGSTLDIIIKTLKKQKIKIVGIQVILAMTDDYKKIAKKNNIKIKFLEKTISK